MIWSIEGGGSKAYSKGEGNIAGGGFIAYSTRQGLCAVVDSSMGRVHSIQQEGGSVE